MTTPAPAPHLAIPDVNAVDAVAVLMRGVQEGSLTGAVMADRAVQRCREVFGQCDGLTDPLWPVHVDMCRAVLGFGGLSAAELAQWLAVARNRENPDAVALAPPAPASSVSESYSGLYAGPDNKPEPESIAAELDTVDALDTLADVPREVLAEAEAAAWAVIEQWRQREAGIP
jgi:hypothetical protein